MSDFNDEPLPPGAAKALAMIRQLNFGGVTHLTAKNNVDFQVHRTAIGTYEVKCNLTCMDAETAALCVDGMRQGMLDNGIAGGDLEKVQVN